MKRIMISMYRCAISTFRLGLNKFENKIFESSSRELFFASALMNNESSRVAKFFTLKLLFYLSFVCTKRISIIANTVF